MADRDSASLRELWEDDELATCPRCNARRLTPPASGMNGYRICLDCGVIGLADGATPADLHERRLSDP
jgi:hypothetical protein